MLTAEQVRIALEKLAPTQEKVNEAVRAAVEVANPSRVILFGSWARGEARWDSDLDMAVLMPDWAEPRLAEIRRALRHKLDTVPMTIDLVIATEEFANRFRGEVNSIYRQILLDGQVAYEQRPYTQAQVLLIKASEDETALHATGNPDSVLGFHAQQAVEKLMKALIPRDRCSLS
jgi:predicted nucleotidyltransferase